MDNYFIDGYNKEFIDEKMKASLQEIIDNNNNTRQALSDLVDIINFAADNTDDPISFGLQISFIISHLEWQKNEIRGIILPLMRMRNKLSNSNDFDTISRTIDDSIKLSNEIKEIHDIMYNFANM